METSQCQEPSYWRAKLLELGVETPKGNRYQLRALYHRTASKSPVSVASEVASEVVGLLLRLGKVANLDARALACTSRSLRETVDASVDTLLRETMSRFSRLRLVMPASKERLAVVVRTFNGPFLTSEMNFSLDAYASVTFGRGREADVILEDRGQKKKISGVHVVIRRKGLGWEVEVLGRNGVLFTPRNSDFETLNTSAVRPIEVGDYVGVPRSVPRYRIELVRR